MELHFFQYFWRGLCPAHRGLGFWIRFSVQSIVVTFALDMFFSFFVFRISAEVSLMIHFFNEGCWLVLEGLAALFFLNGSNNGSSPLGMLG